MKPKSLSHLTVACILTAKNRILIQHSVRARVFYKTAVSLWLVRFFLRKSEWINISVFLEVKFSFLVCGYTSGSLSRWTRDIHSGFKYSMNGECPLTSTLIRNTHAAQLLTAGARRRQRPGEMSRRKLFTGLWRSTELFCNKLVLPAFWNLTCFVEVSWPHTPLPSFLLLSICIASVRKCRRTFHASGRQREAEWDSKSLGSVSKFIRKCVNAFQWHLSGLFILDPYLRREKRGSGAHRLARSARCQRIGLRGSATRTS